MTAGALLALSAPVEPWLWMAGGGALVVTSAALVLGFRRGPVDHTPLDAPFSLRAERRLLALILLVALAIRTVGWDDAVTPAFWFSQVPTLDVDWMLRTGSFWSTWKARFGITQVGWAHESAFVLPVLAALQKLLGPRFGVPVIAGALFGGLAVVLAWAFGRQVRSQAYGLLFAALVACSPLQLTWSRLGAYYIAAVPHVLGALFLGYVAGRRESILLSAIAGAVAWSSLYQYYATRIAIPLTFVALLAGMGRGRTRVSRRLLLIVACAASFAGLAAMLQPGTIVESLWPTYGGYAGNKGERTLADFVARNLWQALHETRASLESYFLWRRTGWDTSLGWGMQAGGLCLATTAMLGGVGLVQICRNLRRQWLWLVIVLVALVPTALSTTTARRLLIFDLAWCGLAAQGLLAMADFFGRSLARSSRAIMVSGAVTAIGIWGTTAVFALSATLPPAVARHIPFGDAGFGDAVTCKRCLEAGRAWAGEIANGAFVVLFDNDMVRENRTSPGGLPTYGKIAALAADPPGRFIEAYALMANWDGEHPTPGAIFDGAHSDFAANLIDRIEQAAPSYVVWHFERPTLWERWLVERLRAAGGRVEKFQTPLSPTGGIRVVTPWALREAAFAVLQPLAKGSAPSDQLECATLRVHQTIDAPAPIFVMTAVPTAGVTKAPEWAVATWHQVLFRTARIDSPTLVSGAALELSPAGGTLRALGENGQDLVLKLGSGQLAEAWPSHPTRHELGCAVRVGTHWWNVDPVAGTVASTHAGAGKIPAGHWIGISRGPHGEVILASADQTITLFDPETGKETARFPAMVSQSVRTTTDECAGIAAGSDWIATLNFATGVLSVYDMSGHPLGMTRLDLLMAVKYPLSAVVGAGHYLGVAANSSVRTFEVSLDPQCIAALGAPGSND